MICNIFLLKIFAFYLKVEIMQSSTKEQIIKNSKELKPVQEFECMNPNYKIAEFKLNKITFDCGQFFNKSLIALIVKILKYKFS